MQSTLPAILFADGLLSGGTLMLIGLVFVVIIGLAIFAIFARYFRLWIQSVTTGAGIGIFDLMRMTFRKVNPTVIVRSKIMAVQAGLDDERRHHDQGARGPLPGRRQRAAGDPLDDHRPQGEDHRPRISSGPRRSTWPAATCSKPCRRASIRG